MKRCTKCSEARNVECFNKDKSRKDGLFPWCKICKRIGDKKYRLANPNKMKEWRERNPDYMKDYNKVYYENNREYFAAHIRKYNKENREWFRAYEARKREFDVNYKLAKNIRNRIQKALKNNRKVCSAVKNLGCSVQFLKQHLELQFQSGMSWNNYGPKGWHMDHIKPLVSFDLTDEKQLLEACHYTNLQPLWWSENLQKHDKVLK